MNPRPENLFSLPAPAAGEQFLDLFENSAVKIVRIVSRSSASPPGFWYDQDEDEWVAVLKGRAVLEFADGGITVMAEGDNLVIPKHVRHRVRETSAETVWLAVHAKE